MNTNGNQNMMQQQQQPQFNRTQVQKPNINVIIKTVEDKIRVIYTFLN